MFQKIAFVDAIAAQPEALARCLSSVRRSLQTTGLAPWRPGETVGLVGMGASTHSGHALVALLAEAGVRAVNLTASDIAAGTPGFQAADHYVIVSESGRSPEPIAAAALLTPGRRIAITNDPDAPLAEAVDATLGLGGFDDSPVYTAGYTATLLAYALLLDRQGVRPAGPDVEAIPATVAAALERYDEVAARLAGTLRTATAVDVVGRGPSLASAAETALMVREALRIHSAAFDTYQYLHGPMEPLRPGSVLIAFGDGRELTVPDSPLQGGAHVILVTSASPQDIPSAGHEALTIVPLPPELTGVPRLVVETVIAQLLVAHAARGLDFKVEDFRYTQADTKLPD